MTKLFNEIKDLDLEASTILLTSVANLDLVREYKQLADLTTKKSLEVEEALELIKLKAKEEPKTERKCISCDNIVVGKAKKCDACKAAPKLKEKEAANA